MPLPGPAPNLNVLLVDDDRDILYTLKRGLERNGCTVTAFDRPADALKANASKFDAAVLDVRMPEVSGFELARKLWKQNDSLQVCFLSAFEIHSSESMVALPSLKSHCFLTKPIPVADLAVHIRSHFAAEGGPSDGRGTSSAD